MRERHSPQELEAMRALMREYAQSLGVDLCFQGFDAELLKLPGDYAAPRGALLAATVDAALAGCCALRPMDSSDYPNACEMKRLYVRPAFRGLGIGRMLAEAVLDQARLAGYHSVLLDLCECLIRGLLIELRLKLLQSREDIHILWL